MIGYKPPTRREARANPLPPFNLSAKCPKCGDEEVIVRYQNEGCKTSDCVMCPVERMERTCQRCHFQWAEAPLKKELKR